MDQKDLLERNHHGFSERRSYLISLLEYHKNVDLGSSGDCWGTRDFGFKQQEYPGSLQNTLAPFQADE